VPAFFSEQPALPSKPTTQAAGQHIFSPLHLKKDENINRQIQLCQPYVIINYELAN